jgi:hypothetical protein
LILDYFSRLIMGSGNGHGGRRKGAGRKPGAKTKKTQEIAARAAEQGVTPLEVLLGAMRLYHERGQIALACAAAKDAAPYVHPRLAATQVTEHRGSLVIELVEEVVIAGHLQPPTEGPPAPGPAGVPPQ